MNDSAILHPLTLPLQGLRLIEASAGTGKTYTIAMLYLRLVLGHQRGLPAFSGRRYLPPDILVLTFTEAAAGELRERIRARLIEAAQVVRRGPVAGTDAMLRELAGEYDDERHGEAAFLLEQAAQWLDEAAISTIHAWCLRVLQQHAFDSGSLFSQTLVQELAPLRQQVVRDVWRQWFYPLPAAQAAVITALLQSPDALADRLQPLLGAGAPAPQRAGRPAAQGWREAWDGLAGAEASLVRARETLWQRWDEVAEAVLGMLARAVSDGVLNKASYKQEWLQEFPEAMRLWLAGGNAPARLAKMTPAELSKGTRKGQTRPEHPWFAQVEAYLACADHLDQPRAAFELALLTDLARAVSAGMASRLRERAELGFDDLLRRVAEALQGPHGERLAQRLRERYPVALIDEFQDTDPLQFGIFSQVYTDQPDT
ncbi:MAG: UvrD-helicase domain-containing protein, partial [Perlucidibaca sp.]